MSKQQNSVINNTIFSNYMNLWWIVFVLG